MDPKSRPPKRSATSSPQQLRAPRVQRSCDGSGCAEAPARKPAHPTRVFERCEPDSMIHEGGKVGVLWIVLIVVLVLVLLGFFGRGRF